MARVRIREFVFDNLSEKYGCMTTIEVDNFVATFNQMRIDGKAIGEPLAFFKRQTIAEALNKVGPAEKWTVEKVREEFDPVFTEQFYVAIRDNSGIVMGEVPAAASPSPKSAAA